MIPTCTFHCSSSALNQDLPDPDHTEPKPKLPLKLNDTS